MYTSTVLESMLNTFVIISFYNNFGVMFKGSLDMTTKSIENWPPSTTPLLINVSSLNNPSEYPHKPYIAENYRLPCKYFCSRPYGSIFIRFHIHCESKRDPYTFAHNFGRCWRIFHCWIHQEICNKNWLSHCQTHLKRVATLPCEMTVVKVMGKSIEVPFWLTV